MILLISGQRVDALRQTLDEFKVEYDDLTKALEGGQLRFKAENKIFLIGSMVTNSAGLHQNLDKNAKVIQDFVENGGIVWEPTPSGSERSECGLVAAWIELCSE